MIYSFDYLIKKRKKSNVVSFKFYNSTMCFLARPEEAMENRLCIKQENE